ncbi:MAG: penicillin-binding protein activator [Proteobacteria bacterium]|nr:penicillin-binding protein activator [Pseudomonadota bacterium]
MSQNRNKSSLLLLRHEPRSISRRLLFISLVLSLLLLNACGTSTVKKQTGLQDTQATGAFQSGNYSTAADLWQQLAQESATADRSYYFLRAADARLLNHQSDHAETLLSQVDPQQLDRRYRALYNAVKGELLLNQGKPEQAETTLAGTSTTNSDLQKRVQRLLDQARLQQQPPELRAWEAFKQRAESTFMSDIDALALLHLLDPVSANTLKDRSSRERGEIPGWIDLTLIARGQYADEDARITAIASWRTAHPFHRLDEAQAYQLATEFNASLAVPGRISILLPQSGRMAAMAAAIRDGLMGSYLNSPQKNRSELRFISTTDVGISQELSLVAETSDQIIGPLDRSEVSQVIRSVPANFPMLALNLPQAESTDSALLPALANGKKAETQSAPTVRLVDESRLQRNPNAVFFPLLPEDEARSAARLAISMGALKMVIIAPDTHLGNRQVDAFYNEYSNAGGQVLSSMRYPEQDVDHSARLKQILGLAQSQQRGNELKRILGGELGFEASVRGDLDAIFLVANPRQGRLIKPQLKFLDAGYLPVLATGMIYSGVPDWNADRDLDGIRMTSNQMALKRVLSLNQDKSEEKPAIQGNGRYDRFTAMGADSWSILPWLPMLITNPEMSYSGLSGELSVDTSGRLQREPVWAYFRNGRLTALNLSE